MKKENTPSFSKEDFELLAEFRYRLRRFLRFSEQAAIEHGLTPQQYQALLAIEGYPGRSYVSITELAERLQIAHHSAVGLVDRLEAAELVKRSPSLEEKPDKRDKRKVSVTLTPHGHHLMEQTYQLHRHELRSSGPQLALLLQKANAGAAPSAHSNTSRPIDDA